MTFDLYTKIKEIDVNQYDIIVKSPGIPYYNKVIKEALKFNKLVITDIELAYMLYPNKEYIGITGTNGKTTTASLIYKMMKTKYDIGLGGNIGKSIFDCIQFDIILLELSSFQLEGVKTFRPKVGVMLNLSSTHIDYHIDFLNYKLAKMNMVKNMSITDTFITYSTCDFITNAKKIFFDSEKTVHINEKYLSYGDDDIIEVNDIKLIGKHNLENIKAAIMVAKYYGISNVEIKNVLLHFDNLEHRIELVFNGDIKIYNDSKSTNPKSTLVALKAMDKKVVLIMGGYDRLETFDVLDQGIKKINNVYVYGDTKKKLYTYFSQRGIKVKKLNTLEKVITHYTHNFCLNDILLFSPGCASWDSFSSYQERGECFKQYIYKLTQSLS